MSDRRRPDPEALSPRAAVERYLRRRRSDAADSSVYAWRYRLKLFVEWCESLDIQAVGELTRLDLDEYYEFRSATIQPATLRGEMSTLRMFVEFLEQIGAVHDLSDGVRVPDVDKEDLVDETRLDAEQAIPLLRYYRSDPGAFGTRQHVFLELAWVIGPRQGGIRALDVRDVHVEESFVEFRHRPETGTPLKNKRMGERPAAIPPRTAAAIGRYLRQHRNDVHDEHGRAPLLASRGRPGPNTVRVWSYLATEPCLFGPCPHGRERETCEYTTYDHASKCPSSRSPHQIRTGSITWQLNLGIPEPVVAERVNASVETIRRHYDQAVPRERRRRQREEMERTRRQWIEPLDAFIDDPPDPDAVGSDSPGGVGAGHVDLFDAAIDPRPDAPGDADDGAGGSTGPHGGQDHEQDREQHGDSENEC